MSTEGVSRLRNVVEFADLFGLALRPCKDTIGGGCVHCMAKRMFFEHVYPKLCEYDHQRDANSVRVELLNLLSKTITLCESKCSHQAPRAAYYLINMAVVLYALASDDFVRRHYPLTKVTVTGVNDKMQMLGDYASGGLGRSRCFDEDYEVLASTYDRWRSSFADLDMSSS